MIHIAYWAVHHNAERLAIYPFNQKVQAEAALAKAKEEAVSDYHEKNYFLQMVKLPLSDLPCSILTVVGQNRTVRGVSENRFGEKIMWRKIIREVEVITLVLDKYELHEIFTSHIHKGALKVSGHKDFYEYAAKRWPTDSWKVTRNLAEVLK